MTEDTLMTSQPDAPQDPRFVKIPALGKWLTLADEKTWDDYDAMMEHLNAKEVQDELAAYTAHLQATAKKKLSRPAVKAKPITVGRWKGQMSQAKPAYVPDEKAINSYVKRNVAAVRDYLVWSVGNPE